MQGVCNEIAGLTGVQCTTIVYDPEDGSGVQCILVITLNAELNLHNIPALQRCDRLASVLVL